MKLNYNKPDDFQQLKVWILGPICLVNIPSEQCGARIWMILRI